MRIFSQLFLLLAFCHRALVSSPLSGSEGTVLVITKSLTPDNKLLGNHESCHFAISRSAISLSPDTRFLFVVNYNANSLSIIGTEDNRVITKMTFTSTDPCALFMTPTEDYVLSSSYYCQYLEDNITPQVIFFPNENSANSVFIPEKGLLYVLGEEGRFLYLVDATTENIIATLQLEEAPKKEIIEKAAKESIEEGKIDLLNVLKKEISPPKSLTGARKRNNFGVAREFFNELFWQPSDSEISGYFLYRNGALIANLPKDVLSFQDRKRPFNQSDTYTLVAYNEEGLTSTAAETIISRKSGSK